LITTCRNILVGVCVALLPWPENERFGSRFEVNASRFSFLVGIIEAPVFALLFFFGAISFMEGTSPVLSMALLESYPSDLNTEHIRATGPMALLVWLLHPLAWFFLLQWATGTLRLVSYATSRQPVGEPSVWAALRLGGAIRELLLRAKTTRDMGPARPDRIILQSDGNLEILSSRDRPEWHDGTTLEFQDRFFHYQSLEKRQDGIHSILVFRFTELDPTEVVRGLVHYQPLDMG